jgi:hypothetical protein
MRVSLTVEKQSCFLTLVAAHPEAAALTRQELGAPPVIRVRVYRSGGYSITSEQGGIHSIHFYLTARSGSENPRELSKVQISYPELISEISSAIDLLFFREIE